MITYKAPIDEYNFLLHDFLKISQQNIQSFNELNSKGVYEIFDYAEFLKNNEEFENSIKYYSKTIYKDFFEY